MAEFYSILESAFDTQISDVNRSSEKHIAKFTATLQEADRKNRNGRIYPKTVLETAIKSPLVQEKLRTHTLFGEAGHPLSTDVTRQTTVDPRNIAFVVNDLYWDGDLLKAHCETADTEAGRDMMGLITENNSTLAFSLRAQGNIVKDPIRDAMVVQPPLMIVSWDWVITPSHDKAWMDSMSNSTQEAMFNYNNYMNHNLALTESMELYENGKISVSNEQKAKEAVKKEMTKINFTESYGADYKLSNKMYSYSSNDKVVAADTTSVTVVDEAANTQKTVSIDDFVTKSIISRLSKNINEDLAGIAPHNCPAPTDPETDADTVDAKFSNDDLNKLPAMGQIAGAADIPLNVSNTPAPAQTADKANVGVKEAATEDPSAAATIATQQGIGGDGVAKADGQSTEVLADDKPIETDEDKDDDKEEKKKEDEDDSKKITEALELSEDDEETPEQTDITAKEKAPIADLQAAPDAKVDAGALAAQAVIDTIKSSADVSCPTTNGECPECKGKPVNPAAQVTQTAPAVEDKTKLAEDLMTICNTIAATEHVSDHQQLIKEALRLNESLNFMDEETINYAKSLLKGTK
jgi:hypothetical protein